MEVGLLINFGSKSLEFKRVMNKKSKFGIISWQSWRAATRNPVEALRYE